MNQNLCTCNIGYAFREEGDPVGGGYTFTNVSYPGKKYNFGNSFREQDIGNLLLMIFESGDYFRFKNVELITDSHFGHLVPMAFCRLWGIYCTSSVLVSRKGVSKLDFLSNKKLSKEEMKKKFEELELEEVKDREILDVEEEKKVEDARLGYCDKKKAPKTLKSNLAFFEHDLSQKPKGYYRV